MALFCAFKEELIAAFDVVASQTPEDEVVFHEYAAQCAEYILEAARDPERPGHDVVGGCLALVTGLHLHTQNLVAEALTEGGGE